MYRQYRDVPRIDQPVAMMAHLHLREMQCKSAQLRIARLARQGERPGGQTWLCSLLRRTRSLIAALPRLAPRAGMGLGADRVVQAPDA